MFKDRKSRSGIASSPVRTATVRLTPVILMFSALSLMAVHRLDIFPIEKLRMAVTDVTAPVFSFVSAPFVALTDSVSSLRTIRDLKAENIRLHEENIKLQQWYETALRLQAQNKSLYDLLNVKADPVLDFVTARVVADPGGAFVKSILLPVGTEDKVKKGNAVMSGKGLVGRIVEAGRHSSRALLITDINSRIPVTIQNTRTRAILAGQNGALLRLERLPPDSGVSVGERIMTSGEGGQLPPDIPIGVISSVDEGGIFVRPLSDMSAPSYVQIVNVDMDPSLVTGEIAPVVSP